MIFYGSLIDKLIFRFKGADKTLENVRNLSGIYINQSYKIVYRSHNWAYRKRSGSILLIPNYTTGTCTVTLFDGSNESSSRTVTFSGATLTASMQGRYFRAKDSSFWHKIVSVNVSTNTIYLDTPIADISSASGLTFEIWKRFYYVKSEVDVVLGFGDWGGRSNLDYDPSSKFESHTSDTSDTGRTTQFSDFGVDPIESTYATGTVSIPADSNVVTGVGTSWLSNADSGDIFVVNNLTFTIKRVETDTQIILHNFVKEEVTAGTAYEIKKDSPLGFQFYFNPDDYRVVPYSYLAKAPSMVHETKDFILLPDEFEDCILTRAEWMRMKDNDDVKYGQTVALYQGLLDSLKIKRSVVQSPFSQFSPKIHTSMPGRY